MNQKQTLLEAGTPDQSFGDKGAVGLPFEGTTGASPHSMLELDNDQLLIAEDPEVSQAAVLRLLNADGTLDKTFKVDFKEGEKFSIPVLSSHPDRGWILTGQLSRPIGGGLRESFEVVVRQFEDGTTDPDFGDNGIQYVDTQKLAVPDKPTPAEIRAERLRDPKPHQHPSRNTGSASPSSVVLPDGKILLTDTVLDYNSVMRGIVVRLNPNGSVDKSFNDKGFTLIELDGIDHRYNNVDALALQKDGKILVTGIFEPLNGSEPYGIYVTRYLENGQLDIEFATRGIAIISLTEGSGWNSVAALAARESDGAIAVAGDLSRQGSFRGWVTVLTPNGSPNLVFNAGKILYSAMLPEGVHWQYCAWQANSALLVSGSGGGGFVGQEPSILIARYLADGAPDTSFNKTGWAVYKNAEGSPTLRDCVVMNDKRIVVCGRASSNARYKGYVARFHG